MFALLSFFIKKGECVMNGVMVNDKLYYIDTDKDMIEVIEEHCGQEFANYCSEIMKELTEESYEDCFETCSRVEELKKGLIDVDDCMDELYDLIKVSKTLKKSELLSKIQYIKDKVFDTL